MLDGDLDQCLAGLVALVVGLVLAHAAADARLALLWFRGTALPSHLHGHELRKMFTKDSLGIAP